MEGEGVEVSPQRSPQNLISLEEAVLSCSSGLWRSVPQARLGKQQILYLDSQTQQPAGSGCMNLQPSHSVSERERETGRQEARLPSSVALGCIPHPGTPDAIQIFTLLLGGGGSRSARGAEEPRQPDLDLKRSVWLGERGRKEGEGRRGRWKVN